MKKISHLIYIPVVGLGIVEWRGQTWFDYRADLMKRFVIPSLKNQTTKDFTIWISFTQQVKENPTIKKIEQDIKDAGLKYIFTFDGVMMHDDRGVWHNKDLPERMAKSLAEVKSQLEPSEWIYKTDLGSDDMFSTEALEEIQKVEPKINGATYYLNGYVLDMENMRVAEWNRDTACSKYTIIYPYNTFFDASEHLKYISGLVSHEFVSRVFNATKLPDGRYMAGTHLGNISTQWSNSFRGKQFGDIDKKEILKKFGINI